MRKWLTLLLFAVTVTVMANSVNNAADPDQVEYRSNGDAEFIHTPAFQFNYLADWTKEVVPSYTPVLVGEVSNGYAIVNDKPPAVCKSFYTHNSRQYFYHQNKAAPVPGLT